MKRAKNPGRVVASTRVVPDGEELPVRWGAQVRTRRGPRTTARTRRGEPDGDIFEGTRRFW